MINLGSHADLGMVLTCTLFLPLPCCPASSSSLFLYLTSHTPSPLPLRPSLCVTCLSSLLLSLSPPSRLSLLISFVHLAKISSVSHSAITHCDLSVCLSMCVGVHPSIHPSIGLSISVQAETQTWQSRLAFYQLKFMVSEVGVGFIWNDEETLLSYLFCFTCPLDPLSLSCVCLLTPFDHIMSLLFCCGK